MIVRALLKKTSFGILLIVFLIVARSDNAFAAAVVLGTTANTPTASPTCSATPWGDAYCDGTTTLLDYVIWRKELTGVLASLTADFNNSTLVDIADFEL